MSRQTPVNITSFEPEQQRAIEDLYDRMNTLQSDMQDKIDKLEARVKELENQP